MQNLPSSQNVTRKFKYWRAFLYNNTHFRHFCSNVEWANLRHSNWLRLLHNCQAQPLQFHPKEVRALWKFYINNKLNYIRHFAHFRKAFISSVKALILFDRTHRTTRFPLRGFQKIIFEASQKKCKETSCFIKFRQL